MRRAFSIAILWLALGAALAGPVQAQVVPGAPQDMLRPHLPTDGKLRFCINANSLLAGFDREVGQALADQLLIEPRFHEMVTVDRPQPLDHRFIQSDVDLFVEVTNECDALLGFPLPAVGPVPDWLTVTRPYYSPPVVLLTRSGATAETPRRIGSLIGSAADAQLRQYVRTHAGWERKVYSQPIRMLDDLNAGLLDAALVWQPVVYAHAGAALAAGTLQIEAPPFPVAPVQMAIGLPSNGVYLRALLDSAIGGSIEQGIIATIAARHGVDAPAD